ncbi:hypothetical protein [Pseudoalteromonas mariniglutinosa]|uniref:hypothetical protein n=1 Tax=Pseudoalteromonas mariniglutinosa TaxID=206042 RepID=UPI00384D6504
MTVVSINQQQAEQQIQTILLFMAKCIEQQNWQKLREADCQLMKLLADIKQATWFTSFAPKLTELKLQYKKNIHAISSQQSELAKKMTRHLDEREGIVAYKQLIEGNS